MSALTTNLRHRQLTLCLVVGLTLSDTVRILLTRVAAEGGLHVGLTTTRIPIAWFGAKVQKALVDPHRTTRSCNNPAP